MAKSNSAQRYVLKLDVNRLKRNDWSLNISFEEATKNKEIISLAEGQLIRFIEKVVSKNQDINVFETKRTLINNIKTAKTKDEIIEYRKQLNEMLYLKEYVMVKFNTKKTFNRANKWFHVNGEKYVRLLGTTGGIKKNTVVYIKEDIYKEVELLIRNGRKLTNRIPAKLEAYRSLVCSSSNIVTYPTKFVVVDDFETTFKTNITYIDSAIDGVPQIKDIEDYEMNHTDSDGYGIISPELALRWRGELDGKESIPTGFCIRNSYMKGMVFTFPIHDFASEIAKKDEIIDVWGDSHKIEDVEMIIPKSVLKLWSDYDNYEHYVKCCKDNGYTFGVTKMISNNNDNMRNLNYQFIQSLDLNDDDIKELVAPTISEFNDILNDEYHKSLLFLTGENVNKDNIDIENGFITALQIESELYNDEFVRNKIHTMLSKKINDSKIGVIKTTGNYQIISGDVYGFAESAFGMENPKGLLCEGEFYSNYWNDKKVKEVVAMRAPMTVDANIRKMKLVKSESTEKWYQYMKNCVIVNAWDATCSALNGADKD